MALSDAEVARIKYELGYNVLAAGAEPYIGGVVAVFNQVIQTYMTSGVATTSSTLVAATTSPTPVTLTLSSATGFTAVNRVTIDVDARMETPTVQSVTGITITVLLSLAHSGTYPVEVDGGEIMVREHLSHIANAAAQIDKFAKSAGVSRVDEIEFFGRTGVGTRSRLDELKALREYHRDELASCLGVERLNRLRGGSGGSRAECY